MHTLRVSPRARIGTPLKYGHYNVFKHAARRGDLEVSERFRSEYLPVGFYGRTPPHTPRVFCIELKHVIKRLCLVVRRSNTNWVSGKFTGLPPRDCCYNIWQPFFSYFLFFFFLNFERHTRFSAAAGNVHSNVTRRPNRTRPYNNVQLFYTYIRFPRIQTSSRSKYERYGKTKNAPQTTIWSYKLLRK